jgi:F0F1-type ATP synthase epsilon subunit
MIRKKPTIRIKIYSPFKIYFDEAANSISAVNETGPFDILPGHKNFMSLLKPCIINVKMAGKPDFELSVSRGVMHVRTNEVTVFLDV